MDNEERIDISISRGGFISLIDVENYIRQVTERYTGQLGGLFLRPYSSVNYNNGSWSANVSFSNVDPATVGNAEPDFGW